MRMLWILYLGILIMLGACDQFGSPGAGNHKKLSPEQIKERIHLQKRYADVKDRLSELNQIIDKATKNLADLKKEHHGKFYGININVGTMEPLGPAEASVAIVGFIDFQCDECALFAFDVLPKIQKNYIDTGNIRYYSRDFVQPRHDQAKYAAVAAFCANEQGMYWPMHEALFVYHNQLNQHSYPELSRQIGLDPEKLTDCLVNSDSVQKVEEDHHYGESVDVISPPTFFLGILEGDQLTDVIMIIGARPYAEFAAMIDVLLTMSATHNLIEGARTEKAALVLDASRLQKLVSQYQ